MGKRKKAAKKPTGKKGNAPLPTIFPCLFCNHESSVSVKIDRKGGVGQLSCKVCSQQFQCAINYLSAPVDVYADWVDACDTVAKEGGDHTGIGDFGPSRVSLPGSRNNAERARDEEDERDDDIIDDEDDDGADGYGGDGIVADDEY